MLKFDPVHLALLLSLRGDPDVDAEELERVIDEQERLRVIDEQERLREQTRPARKKFYKLVNVISPDGLGDSVCRSSLFQLLQQGYTFGADFVYVKNDQAKQMMRIPAQQAKDLILSDIGWDYGSQRGYVFVSNPSQLRVKSLKR